MKIKILILLLGVILSVSSCSTSKPKARKKKGTQTPEHSQSTRYRVPYDNAEKQAQTKFRPVKDPQRKKLQRLIREIIGKKGTIVVEGRSYHADCSGMVRGVYEAIGVDLMEHSQRFPEAKGGVEIIYKSFKHRQWKSKKRIPQPGDLVFFNNTWDQNGNHKWDDPLTHVAMVEGIEEGSNTVSFIHSVHRGIRRYRLNLDHPKNYMHKGRKMNDFLRRRPDHDPDRTKYMSSNLFFSYIDVLNRPKKKR